MKDFILKRVSILILLQIFFFAASANVSEIERLEERLQKKAGKHQS